MEDAELVESGSFRVDRAKALEKLSGFQLANPETFLNCWIRSAEASGAREISVDFNGKELEFRFDGRPFRKQELKDPYGGLFADEGNPNPRLKHFGYGVLGALRLGAAEIRLVSGDAGERMRLRITGLDRDTLEALEGDSDSRDTLVRVSWPRGEAPESVREGIAKMLADARFPRARLRCFGELQRPSRPGDKPSVRFDHGARRGWLEVVGGETGDVEISHLGVLVETITMAGPLTGVWGAFDDEGLRLTASLDAFVKDAAFEAARECLNAQGRRLLLRVAGLRAATLRRQMALQEDREWLIRFGRWTHWALERCADALKDPRRDRSDRFKRALWDVPLISDMRSGAPVSLFDLWTVRERTGSILVSNRELFRRADYSWDLFWVPDERAVDALERLFGSTVRREKIA